MNNAAPKLKLEPKADDSQKRQAECTEKLQALLKEYRCGLEAPVVFERGPEGWIRAKAPEIRVVAEK